MKGKPWTPPVLSIAGMILLARWIEVAQFFLFRHHLFWMVGAILLINPISETFWPSEPKTGRKGRIFPQPSAKTRARQEARKSMAKQKHAPESETMIERLARLHKQKEAVDSNSQYGKEGRCEGQEEET